MSTQVATKKPDGLRQWFSDPAIVGGIRDALAGYMDAEQFLAQILIHFAKPEIARCTPKSLFSAAHTCAMLGLLPSLQQVAIIPRKDEATVMPQWQGYQALMLRHPSILDLRADLVHVRDRYHIDPTTQTIHHEFDPFDAERKIEKIDDLKGGYLTVWYKDGRPKRQHFVSAEDFRKARGCAQATNVWDKWVRAQCLKTVFRDAYARRIVPIDPLVHRRMEEALAQEDRVFGNDPNRVVVEATAAVAPASAPAASRTQRIAERMATSNAPELEHAQEASAKVVEATATRSENLDQQAGELLDRAPQTAEEPPFAPEDGQAEPAKAAPKVKSAPKKPAEPPEWAGRSEGFKMLAYQISKCDSMERLGVVSDNVRTATKLTETERELLHEMLDQRHDELQPAE